MKKENFCECMKVLRDYSSWERAMYGNGVNLDDTPLDKLTCQLIEVMCDFNVEWAYDEYLGFNWIIEAAFNDSPHLYQKRHGQEWNLEDTGALYDFIVFMNEHGWWEDE